MKFMKNFFLLSIALLIDLAVCETATAQEQQSITLHDSYSYYYRGDGPYSCTPNPSSAYSVNSTYFYSNPGNMGSRASYSKNAGGEGYMIYNGVCLYNVYGTLSVWWNEYGWVLGYRAQTGPNTFTNSIALFNGLNTAKPPCKGWGNGYLTGDCVNVAVTVTSPAGAPDINAGDLVSIGSLNGKNAYEMPVRNASVGAKVTIFYDGTKWVVTYSNPSARMLAETQLSTNAADNGNNPPCSGWSNGYSFAGAICEGGLNGVLPVTLVSFNAKAVDEKTVKLDWKTAQELNSSYFGVERSKDMTRFEQIARIRAGGTTTDISNYTLTDETPLGGRSYYRLKQVDLDGKETIYRAVTVRMSGTDSPYPNPSRNGVVQIEANQNAVIHLTDLSGRPIGFDSRRMEGDVTEIIPKQRLQAGVYVISNNGLKYKVVVE
jgi:hypothetical protein